MNREEEEEMLKSLGVDRYAGISKPKYKNLIQIMNDYLAQEKGFKVDAFSAFRMVPECGELVDAVLKIEGLKKIKSTDDISNLMEELRGEVGDVLVLLAQVCSHYRLDMEECYQDKYAKIMKREFHK